MRRILVVFIIVLLMLYGVHPAAAQQVTAQSPVVHAVLFWMAGCSNCEEVMQSLLPQMEAQYGAQLDVQLVEVSSTEDVARLYQIGASYGLEKEEIGVPLVLIADQALVGSEQIPAKFSGLVERYLAAGGVDTPDLVRLATGTTALAAETKPLYDGMVIAWGLLIGMLVALVFGGTVVGMALQGKSLLRSPAWLDLAFPVLGLIGLGVALYLVYVETTPAQAICGPLGDCNAVQDSPYALIFGWLPVGIAGALGYLAILGAWFWGRRSGTGLGAYVPVALLGMSAFGTLYSVYLTYLEIFVIHAVCMWCITSAVTMTLIFLASLPKAAAWLTAAEESEA